MRYNYPCLRLLARVITLGLRGGYGGQAYISPESLDCDKVACRGSTYWRGIELPILEARRASQACCWQLPLYKLAMQLEPCAALYPSVMAPQSASEGQQHI